MAWAHYQQVRLAQEMYLLRRELPDFAFYDTTGYAYVNGYWRSQKNNIYGIRIDIPAGYPEECPSTYIVHPAPLLDYWNRPVTAQGTSHTYHTWETNRAGLVQICTYKPVYWDASNTTVQLIHKAFLWIIAYEEHRWTGKNISDLLLTMA